MINGNPYDTFGSPPAWTREQQVEAARWFAKTCDIDQIRLCFNTIRKRLADAEANPATVDTLTEPASAAMERLRVMVHVWEMALGMAVSN